MVAELERPSAPPVRGTTTSGPHPIKGFRSTARPRWSSWRQPERWCRAEAAAVNQQVGNAQRGRDVQCLGHLKALDEAANRRRGVDLLLSHDALPIAAKLRLDIVLLGGLG